MLKHAEAVVQKTTEMGSYHAFRIGDIGFLIPQDVISEVAEELPYCQLPNTSMVLFGMANSRGNIIPIFDLHELFGFSNQNDSYRKILIIGSGDDAIAVMTSELPIRINISPEQRLRSMPPIPDILRPFTKGCYQEKGIWLDIDNEFYASLSNYLQ